MAMIPMCLVTGFLGSGKTTFLKRLVARYRDRRIIYLVNEFCAADIDGALLSADTADVVTIPGGSIFCACLVTQFVGQLTRLAEAYPDAEGVVIEASGMANPLVVDRMLSETGLHRRFLLTNVVTVVDPGTFPKLRATLPNMVDQVSAADVVLINKVDLHGAEAVDAVERAVRGINGRVAVLRAARADAAIDPWHGTHTAQSRGEYAACRDPRYESVWIDCAPAVTADAVAAALTRQAGALYRAKGYVGHAPVNHVELAAGAVTVTPVSIRVRGLGLAVIARGDAAPGWLEDLRGACGVPAGG